MSEKHDDDQVTSRDSGDSLSVTNAGTSKKRNEEVPHME